jgi:hypothetical protein
MQANGATKLFAYGQYLGNRYRGFSNILWVHGGDYNVPDKDLVRAIVNGIRDVETVSLHTYHGSRGTGALEFFTTAEPWLTVSNIYTDNTTVVAEAYAEYARSGLPFFLIEALYENEGLDASGVRAQAYQAVLSGAFGQLMGNSPIWFFGQSWQQALNSAGARSMQRMRELLNGFAWWKLVPDTNASFVTAGLSSGSGRTAAARANDASFGLVYVAFNHSITVNTTLLSGPRIMARWCDPAPNGACSTISGSPFNPSPAHSFTPPGNSDWVLALEAVP